MERLAGGRLADVTVEVPNRPEIRRLLRAARVVIVLCITIAALGVAIALRTTRVLTAPALIVDARSGVLLAITSSLLFLHARAQHGQVWAFRRLAGFSRIFPLIALGVAAVPGLLPVWARSEQLALAAFCTVLAVVLSRPPLLAHFRPDPPP
ncbi:hypothetical protein [Jatrophihabitans endophyticus]|uniref:hypothetical protein n=1 Tax=Jatrophihabitans endophyticus TaxID=1206085 RepID=UPI001A0CCEB8|nr:hypothetical protein [Jatrophihabitans endophyticus]MBE7189620.1 hypothetical protein [Jatrophihabitans endophyticus]